MRRKLVKQGQNALTVTLPAKWLQSNGLVSGNEVDIEEVENQLMISSEAKLVRKDLELDMQAESEQLIRIHLNAVYRLGYDLIKVKFKTKKQADIIRKTVEKLLLGFEITEESEHLMTIDNVTEPSEEKQDILMRRMVSIIKESLNVIKNDLEINKFESINTIKGHTKRFDRYNNFCRRNISKKRFTDERVNYYWELFGKLIFIQHSILHLYETVVKDKKVKLSENFKKIFSNIIVNFDNIITGFFKQDLNLIQKVNDELKKILYEEIHVTMLKSKGVETISLYYAGELSRLIYLMSIPMLAIRLK